jgi:hypothetical protein
MGGKMNIRGLKQLIISQAIRHMKDAMKRQKNIKQENNLLWGVLQRMIGLQKLNG